MDLAEWLGLEVLGNGRVRMRMTHRTRNPVDHIHGGALASLAEEAAAGVLPEGVARIPDLCATALNINYIRPSATPWVVAEAGLIWAGAAACACRVDVRDANGKETCRALIQFGVVPRGSGPGSAGPAAGPEPRREGAGCAPGQVYDRSAGESYRNALGIRSLLMEPGRVEMMLPAAPHLAGRDGALSLGLLAGLMDNGGGQSLLGNLPAHWTATINLQAHLLRRIPPATLCARVEAIRNGRTVGVVSGTVFADGIPVAAGMASFIMKRNE